MRRDFLQRVHAEKVVCGLVDGQNASTSGFDEGLARQEVEIAGFLRFVRDKRQRTTVQLEKKRTQVLKRHRPKQ